LIKCSYKIELGLRVPAVLFVDDENGVILMEYIEGERISTVFENLGASELVLVAKNVGRFAAIMHSMKIYHGDFTLANLLLTGDGVVVIDFGLAGYSDDIEEYAIDLHLMSRSAYALSPEKAGVFIKHLIDEYKNSFPGNAEEIVRRMKEIQVRGRYVDKELRKSISRERYVK